MFYLLTLPLILVIPSIHANPHRIGRSVTEGYMCTEDCAFPDCMENTSLQILNEGRMFTVKINHTSVVCKVYCMKHFEYDLDPSAWLHLCIMEYGSTPYVGLTRKKHGRHTLAQISFLSEN